MKILNLSDFQSTDREQCGILIECDSFIRVVEIPNVNESPEGYVIKISDVELVRRGLIFGEVILGFFHTHLPHHGPNPSDHDFDGAALSPGMQNAVYHPATGSLIWYGDLTEVI